MFEPLTANTKSAAHAAHPPTQPLRAPRAQREAPVTNGGEL